MPDPKKGKVIPNTIGKESQEFFQNYNTNNHVGGTNLFDASEAFFTDQTATDLTKQKSLIELEHQRRMKKKQEEEIKNREKSNEKAKEEAAALSEEIRKDVEKARKQKEENDNNQEQSQEIFSTEDKTAASQKLERYKALIENNPNLFDKEKSIVKQFEKALKDFDENQGFAGKVMSSKYASDALDYIGSKLSSFATGAMETKKAFDKQRGTSKYDPDSFFEELGLGVIKMTGDTFKSTSELRDNFLKSQLIDNLPEEIKNPYLEAKKTVLNSQVPESVIAYEEQTKLNEDLTRMIDEKIGDPTNTLEVAKLRVLRSKLRKSMKLNEDIIAGNTDLSFTLGFNEMISKNLGNLNFSDDRDIEFWALPVIAEEFRDFATGASNIQKTIDKETQKYSEETGIPYEDFSSEDHAKIYESLSDVDKLNMQVMAISMRDQELLEMTSLGYQTAVGAGHSFGMMTGFIPGMGAGKIASRVMKGRKVLRALESGKKQFNFLNNVPKLKNHLGTAGKYSRKGAKFTFESSVASVINPMFINQQLRDNTNIGWIQDDEENYVGMSAGEAYKQSRINILNKQKNNLEEYKKSIEALSEKEFNSLPREEVLRYHEINAYLGVKGYEDAVDENGNDIIPIDNQIEGYKKATESQLMTYGKGFALNGVEMAAERFVGKSLGKLGTYGKNQASKIEFLDKAIKRADKTKRNLRQDYHNTKVGKAHKKFSELNRSFLKTGDERLIQSLPVEVIEEYAAETGQALIEFAGGTEDGIGALHEAYKTMTSWEFNRDVVLQTAFMKGTMGASGGAKKASLMIYSHLQTGRLKTLNKRVEAKTKEFEKATDLETKEKLKEEVLNIRESINNISKNKTLFGGIGIGIGKAADKVRQKVEQEKIHDKIIEDLRKGGNIDSETEKMLSALDPTSQDMATKLETISQLRKEGKVAEAEQVRLGMVAGLMEASIHLGSTESMLVGLEKSLKDGRIKDPKAIANTQKLIEITKTVDNHLKKNDIEKPRTLIGAKILLQQGLYENAIREKESIIEQGLDAALTDLNLDVNTGGIDSGSLSVDEVHEVIKDIYNNPYEEGTDKYKDFEKVADQLLERTTKDDLSSYIFNQTYKQQLQSDLQDAKVRYKEVMNPTPETEMSENAFKFLQKKINNIIEDYGTHLTEEEYQSIFDKYESELFYLDNSDNAKSIVYNKLKSHFAYKRNAQKKRQEQQQAIQKAFEQFKKEQQEKSKEEDTTEEDDVKETTISQDASDAVANAEEAVGEVSNEYSDDIFGEDNPDTENPDYDPDTEQKGRDLNNTINYYGTEYTLEEYIQNDIKGFEKQLKEEKDSSYIERLEEAIKLLKTNPREYYEYMREIELSDTSSEISQERVERLDRVLYLFNKKDNDNQSTETKTDLDTKAVEQIEADLKLLLEEKEQVEKEIEEIEKESKGSEISTQVIEDTKKEISNLRNEDGSIPDSKMSLFNKLSKKIRFLQKSFKGQVLALIDSFTQLNNLSGKDIKLLNHFVEFTDYTFEEVIQQLEKRNNTTYKRPSELEYFEDSSTRAEKLNESQESADENTNKSSKLAAKELGIDLDKVYYANELDDFVQKHGSKQTKFIWNLIKNIAEKLRVPTKFLLEGKGNNIEKGNLGEYSNGQVANRASLFSSPDVAARIIVHELVHGVTSYIISAVKKNQTEVLNKLTSKQINAAKKLSNLLRELQTDSSTKDFYGSKNEHEILAELTHDDFTEALKNKKLNFVEKFLDYILDILGIPTNAYNEALGILKDMIENPIDYISEGFVTEGVYYSKNESTKLQQLKQRLVELNKAIDKINAKYDAKLKALEEQDTSDPEASTTGEEAFTIDLTEESKTDDLTDLPDGEFSLNFDAVSENELDPEKVKQVEQSISSIVRLLSTIGKTEGTFTDVLNEFLAYESVPGKMTTGEGLAYLVEAWKNLNKKYNKKGTPVFEKGEIQAIQDKFKTLRQNSNGIQEALEKRRIEGIKESTATIDPTEENVGNKTKKSDQVKLDEEANEKILKKENPEAVEKEEEGVLVKEDKEGKKGQAPRLAYLTLSYKREYDENGQLITKTDDFERTQREKSEDGKWIVPDPRVLLHPDNTNVMNMDVEVASESDWNKIPISVEGRDQFGKPLKSIPFSEWVAQKEEQNPNFRNTKEFYSQVPIYAKRNGKIGAFIHTQDWFNGYSIQPPFNNTGDDYIHPKDYQTDSAWNLAVERAKDRNFELRKALLLSKVPPKKIKITRVQEGPHARVEINDPRKDMLPLSQANPQAEIAVMTSDSMETFILNDLGFKFNRDKGFRTGDKILLNDPNDFTYVVNKETGERRAAKGHTFAIYRVGTIERDGKKVETYRAFKVARYQDKNVEKQLDTLMYAFGVHNAFRNKEDQFDLPSKYTFTKEQARKINSDLGILSNENLSDVGSFLQFANKFYKLSQSEVTQRNKEGKEKMIKSFRKKGLSKKDATAKVNEIYKENDSTDYLGFSLMLVDAMNESNVSRRLNSFTKRVVQNTRKDALQEEKKVIHITNKGIENTGKTYKEYLKDHILTTSFKAYNMAEEGKPESYTSAIQPVLEIEDSFENLEYEEQLPEEFESKEEEYFNPEEELEKRNEDSQEVDDIKLNSETEKEIRAFIQQYLRTDLDSFLEKENSESGLSSTLSVEELRKYFTGNIAGVSIHKILPFINLTENTIVRLAKFRESLSKESVEGIRMIAKRRLDIHIANVEKKIGEYLDALDEVENKTQTQSALQSALESNLDLLYKISNNFDTVFSEALEKTKIEDLSDSENYLTENEKVEKNYSKDAIEETVKARATAKIKMLLSGIPVYDDNGNIQYDYAGIPQYMSLDDAYNLVLKAVSIGTDPKGTFESIMKRLKESSNPAISEIIKRLNNSDGQLKNQFVVNSTMHSLTSRFVMYEANKDGSTNLKVYDTNSSTTKRSVIEKWKDNVKSTSLYNSDGSFNITHAKKLRENLKNLPQDFSELKTEDLRKWLESVGIEMHPKTWESVLVSGVKSGNTVYSLSQMWSNFKKGDKKSFTLFGKLDNFLKEAIDKPSDYSVEGIGMLDDIVGVLNGIAQSEAENNPELISLVYRDSGKTISTLTPPKMITDEISKLIDSANQNGEYINEIRQISFSSNSFVLDVLEKSQELRDFFGINHTSLTALMDKNKRTNKEKKAIALDSPEFLMASLGAFQDRKTNRFSKDEKINGLKLRLLHMVNQTMSDKDTTLMSSTVGLDLLNQNDAFIRKSKGIGLSSNVLNFMYDRLVGHQIQRAYNFHLKETDSNIKAYDDAAGLISVDMPGLNSLQVNGMNLAQYVKSSAKEGTELNQNAIKSVVLPFLQNFIKHEVKNKVDVVNKFGIKKTKNSKGVEKVTNSMIDSTYIRESSINIRELSIKEKNTSDPVIVELAMYDFVVNDLLHKAEMEKLFISDPALYHKHKFPNKDIYNLSTAEYIQMAKGTGVNLGKRLALLIAPGKKIADVDQTYKQIFLQDPVDISENIYQLVDWFYPKNKKAKELVGEVIKLRQQMSKKTNEKKLEILKSEHKSKMDEVEKTLPIIEGYFKLESADAQEYTTVAEHLNVMYLYGQLEQNKYEKIRDAYKKGGLKNLSKEDQAIVMQPMKPVHTGIYNDVEQDVRRVVYIKSSSIPLFPEFTKGTQLDNLRVAMEDLESKSVDNKGNTMYVRASYQTANKVGAMKNTVNIRNNESINKLGLPNSEVSLNLSRNNFRIQQDVPHKSSKKGADKISMGTQIFKLLFGDGILDVKGKVFPYNGEMVNAKTLKEAFDTNFNIIYDTHKKKLLGELGLDEVGNKVNEQEFRIKLSEVLKKEAKERNYDLKSLDNLDLVIDGGKIQFVSPLWLSSDSNRFEALLNSIITNRLMQFKLPGNGFVAASENGTNFKSIDELTAETRNNIIYLNGWNGIELQGTKEIDGKIQPAQVMVESKFKDAEGNLLDLFEDFNGQEGKYITTNSNGSLGLKTEMFDPEILNMFTFRTPTSGHVSGSSVEVVGILPPQSGDVMVVPKNFTQQKGLDFDVDKEGAYILNHYIDDEGKIKVYNESYRQDLNKLLDEVETPNEYVYQHLLEDFNITYLTASADPRFSGLKSRSSRNQIYKLAKLQLYLEDYYKETQNTKGFALASLFDVYSPQSKLVLENKISELRQEINSKEDPDTVTKVFSSLIKSFRDAKNGVENSFDTKMNEIILANIRKEAENKLNKKIAENNFIRTHLGVFNSNSDEVQRKINKILSMDFASQEANRIEAMNEEAKKKAAIERIIDEHKTETGEDLGPTDAFKKYEETELAYFNLLSHDYQKEKADLGAIGKTAIGIYSVALTFNSLVQQKYGSKGMPIDEFFIGNVSSSNLASMKSSGENYTTSESLQEKQNTATDNEKEQILGRVGIDSITITADAHGTLRGFGKDENGQSIMYNLLSQPIVKEFSKRLKESKGMLGEYIKDSKLIQELLYENGSGYEYKIDEKSLKYTFYDSKGQPLREKGSKKLTGNVLNSGIESGSISGDYQALALKTFIELINEGKTFVPKISSLNNNELGKSIIGVEAKKEKLHNTLKDDLMIPLFGEKVAYGTEGSFPVVIPTKRGAITYGVMPTTPQGKIAIDGILTHEKLFSDLFPYSNPAVQSAFNSILGIKEVEKDFRTPEDYEKIAIEMKKFIFSLNDLGVFNSDANQLRQYYMKEEKGKKSLASYVKDLLRNEDSKFEKGLSAIKNNPLLSKKLSYKVSKSPNEISRIIYDNASSENIDDKILYESLPLLAIENQPLPDYNGEAYDTKKLAEDLIRYSFLQGGVQEATEFIKYIPVKMLSAMKTVKGVDVNKALRHINNHNTEESYFTDLLRPFIKQYFQNNVKEAPHIDYTSIKFKDGKLLNSKTNQFIQRKVEGVVKLYQLSSVTNENQGVYEEIPTTNTNYITQYNAKGEVKDVNKTEVEQPKINNQFTFSNKTYSSVSDLLKDTENVPNNLKAFADLMLTKLDPNMELRGVSNANDIKGFFSQVRNEMYLNMDIFNTSNKDEMFATALHEAMHSVLKDDFNKYYTKNPDGSYQLKSQDELGEPIPSTILELNVVYNEAIEVIDKHILENYELSQEQLNQIKEAFKEKTVGLKNKDSDAVKRANEKANRILEGINSEDKRMTQILLYSVSNPNEMLAHLIESPELKNILNNVPYKKSGKSLFQKLVEMYKAIIKALYPEVKKDSLAEAGLTVMTDLITNKKDLSQEIETTPETTVETKPTTKPQQSSRIDTELKQERDTSNIKQGVSELFEANPELANSIYEAMGFEQGSGFKIETSNTLNQFLEPFFNSNDGSIVESLAKKLTNKDKQILAKAVGRNYKDINQFDWYEAIWSDVGQQEVYYYLKTGNNLPQDVQKEKINSKLYNEWQNFIKENKEFVDNFKNFPKEIQKEQQKDFDKLKEKNEWYQNQLSDLEYNIEKKLLKETGYVEFNIQLTNQITQQQKQEAQQVYSNYLDTIFPDSKEDRVLVHASHTTTINKFEKRPNTNFLGFAQLGQGVYVTTPSYLDYWRNELELKEGEGRNYYVKVNLQNTLGVNNFLTKEKEKTLDKNIDAVYENRQPHQESGNWKPDQYSIRNPEQIHILGGKQDIQGFKEFVGKQQDDLSINVEDIDSITSENSANFAITDSGQLISDLGITEAEWQELSQEEQDNIKRCS